MEKEIFVSKDMTVGEVIKKYPNVVEILQSFGLQCVGCSVNPYETIEQGTVGHGMSENDMNSMIKEANEYLGKVGSGKEEEIEHNDDHGHSSTPATGDVVVLTENAANKVKEYMKSQNKEGEKLRVSVQPGGCAGFTYGLEFVKESNDNEMVIEQHGVEVLVEKEIAPEITGLTIDFLDSLEGSGFKISNPNATSSCGCGKSFR